MLRNKQFFCWLFFAATTAGIVWLLRPISPESFVSGKPESYWIALLADKETTAYQRNWKFLGTNATAVELKALEVRNGPLKTAYRKMWPKMPAWIKSRWPRPVDIAAARTNAMLDLTVAKNSPLLLRLLKTNDDPFVRANAAAGLTFDSHDNVTLALLEALHKGVSSHFLHSK